MVRIKCVNPNCTSPSKSFKWDESKHVESGGGIAQPHESDAVRIIAECPFCGEENIVWVKKAKSDKVVRVKKSKK